MKLITLPFTFFPLSSQYSYWYHNCPWRLSWGFFRALGIIYFWIFIYNPTDLRKRRGGENNTKQTIDSVICVVLYLLQRWTYEGSTEIKEDLKMTHMNVPKKWPMTFYRDHVQKLLVHVVSCRYHLYASLKIQHKYVQCTQSRLNILSAQTSLFCQTNFFSCRKCTQQVTKKNT